MSNNPNDPGYGQQPPPGHGQPPLQPPPDSQQPPPGYGYQPAGPVYGYEQVAPAFGQEPPGPKRRTGWVLVIVVLLAAVGAAAAYVIVTDDDSSTGSTTQPTTGSGGGQAAPSGGQRNPGGQYTYGLYERITFAAGGTSTTVSGGTVAGTVNGYVLTAGANQEMVLRLVSPNAVWELYGPDDSLLESQPGAGPSDPGFVLTLPADGDYLVVISSTGGNASYDLEIQITTVTGG